MQFFAAKPHDLYRIHVALDRAELPIRVKVSKGGRRSTEQNAYLWGVVYETILSHSLREQGFYAEDLHEYFLGEYHGWETLEGLGRKRLKPIERSSGKSKAEFTEYVEFVRKKAAEMSIYIPDPHE